MAGIAALRAGAGLSTVATAKSVLATVAGFHPELMTEPLEETDAGSIALAPLQQGRLDTLVKAKRCWLSARVFRGMPKLPGLCGV